MRLLIATPAFGGNLTTDYVGSLLNTLSAVKQNGTNVSIEVYFLKHESLISRGRNNCASYALKGGFDKMLFIDADQAWSPADFFALLNSERTLVGGTYCKKTLPWDLNFTPLAEHSEKFFPDGVKNVTRYSGYIKETADANGEVEVRCLPTGFLLVDRKVLNSLEKGCPSYQTRDHQHAEVTEHRDYFPSGVINGAYESEDFFFCLQAREAGHIPYLNTRVIVDHLGQLNYRIPDLLRPK